MKVNVLNATSRNGLAKAAANEFKARKFVLGKVANTETGYRGVAAIVSGAAGQGAAFTVQRNLPGSDYFQDGRKDATVDVILTGDYRGLVKPQLVDQTRASSAARGKADASPTNRSGQSCPPRAPSPEPWQTEFLAG